MGEEGQRRRRKGRIGAEGRSPRKEGRCSAERGLRRVNWIEGLEPVASLISNHTVDEKRKTNRQLRTPLDRLLPLLPLPLLLLNIPLPHPRHKTPLARRTLIPLYPFLPVIPPPHLLRALPRYRPPRVRLLPPRPLPLLPPHGLLIRRKVPCRTPVVRITSSRARSDDSHRLRTGDSRRLEAL